MKQTKKMKQTKRKNNSKLSNYTHIKTNTMKKKNTRIQKGSGIYFNGGEILKQYVYYYSNTMKKEYTRLTMYLLHTYNKNRHKYIEMPFVSYIHRRFVKGTLSKDEICSLLRAFILFQENPIPNTMEFLAYSISICRQ